MSTGNSRLWQLMGDIQASHTDTADAPRIASEAQVHRPVFTHLNPPLSIRSLNSLFYWGLERVRAKD